jgi:hypothetical protein
VFVDDVLVFRGELLMSPNREDICGGSDGSLWGSLESLDLSQSILFSNDEMMIRREGHRCIIPENDLCFIDEGKFE